MTSLVKCRVAGMITMYNSDHCLIDRIDTYVHQVQILFIIDNSEFQDNTLVSAINDKYSNVKYITNNGNMGVANALNVAAKHALSENFEYLLLMDDDSSASDLLVETLMRVAQNNGVGLVSPQSNPSNTKSGTVEVLTAITSGSILKMSAYVHAGPFMDELFIDWVDHEYCFRLQKFGYRIMLVNEIKLTHRLGEKKTDSLFGLIRVSWRSHNPVRLYYKFRNSIFVLKLYSKQIPLRFKLYAYKELIEDFFKIVFLERNKKQYIELVRKAFQDVTQKRLGKLE